MLKRIVSTLIAVLALAPGPCAAQTASERLEHLAAQAQERALDLFPVAEIFSRGPGPRQDRLELTLGDEHRERQRVHHRWILGELARIPADELSPTEVSSFDLAALLAHEGMPGHHIETGIKLENNVPEFRRRLWFNAFGEGWALYAETLGHELGLYEQPVELLGRYSFELLRACRLVADTGLHAKDWTREQAIRFLVGECAQTEGLATNEVLRNMVWPGQALGYKIGELTILELRANAEKRLGQRMDLRAFHDAILEEGHLPMSMLRQRMDAWIDGQDK